MAQAETIFDYLRRWKSEKPDRVALVDDKGSYTYAEYADGVATLAARLAAAGINAGDAVAVAMPKCAEMPLAYLAAAAVAAVPFPVDFKSDGAAWRALVAVYAPRAVIVLSEATPPAFLSSAAATSAILGVEESLAAGAAPATFTHAKTTAEDILYLNMTSGVSGRPKAAAATHGNVIANALAANAALSLGPGDVTLCTFAAHAHPHETFARALVTGGRAAFVESIRPRAVLAAVERFSATAVMGGPPLLRSLIPYAAAYDTSSLRVAEAGGMTAPEGLPGEFEAAFGIPLSRVWGATETSGIALLAAPEAPASSLGKPSAGYTAEVVDDGGDEVAVGEEGELNVAGPGCVAGYWRRGRVEPFAAAFVRTGDLVRREADGTFTFLDRRDGLMKVAGEKVYAGEIERVLRQHPAVTEAVVMAAPDDVRGQVPHAFVEPFGDLELDAAAVAAFAQERLPAIKRPKKITVVKELPKVGSGKIDRKNVGANIDAQLEALAATDEEILKLLNWRYERLRELAASYPLAARQRLRRRLRAANAGPLHNDTVEEIFRKLDELMGM